MLYMYQILVAEHHIALIVCRASYRALDCIIEYCID